ncbi:hypothetical protein E1298_40930, partial [Actinomadura rubrisoli]
MRVRARSTLPLAGAAALAFALAGCGGGEEDGAGAAAPTTLAPLPKVAAADVKPLAGRWIGTAEDYFRFTADGTGVWMRGKRKLWGGTAIPCL